MVQQAPTPTIVAPEAFRGIPGVLVGAYRAAAKTLATEKPGCGITWFLLAGVGRIESDHAQGGAVDATGRMKPTLVGPQLDGAGNFAEIRDSDGGLWDGDKTYDRALGPMQFLPGTWRLFGRDGNGDGTPDPQNVHDATLAAATYLCASGGDLRVRNGLLSAVFAYNRSWDYVTSVLTWAGIYAGLPAEAFASPTPTPTPTLASTGAPSPKSTKSPRPASPRAAPPRPTSSPSAPRSAAPTPTVAPTPPPTQPPTPTPTASAPAGSEPVPAPDTLPASDG
ncbi:MAG: lytic transglycosylase domain-containing protein [Sporichthyaceae bacterium]